MNDDDAPNFKIRLDDDVDDTGDEIPEEMETPDEVPEKPRRDRRIAEPKRKIGLTSVLLVVLAAVVLAGIYFNLKSQIAANTNAGASAVTSLSLNLESRLISIADTQVELNKKLDADLETINSRIKKIEKSVSAIRTSKSDKTEVQKALGDIEKNISPVRKKVEDMASRVSALDESTRKKISGFSTTLTEQASRIDKAAAESGNYKSEVSRLNAEISQLKAEKLSKASLEESLRAENERYATRIDNLNREMSLLKLRAKTIEDRLTEISRRPAAVTQPSAPVQKGDIQEQTIR